MGFLLLLPFFIIRFGLLAKLNKDALKRAAYFAPLKNKEITAYWIYQVSNIAIFVYICFLKIKLTLFFYPGLIVYMVGTILLTLSVINFAAPNENCINQNGLYKLSRNPMYVAYFIFFIGCVLMTQSFILFALVLFFQASAHWIILAEERWCCETFGKDYLKYMEKVRRYM